MAGTVTTLRLGLTYDDGGRAITRGERERGIGDCVTRALAILTGRDYEECWAAVADAEVEGGSTVRTADKGSYQSNWSKVYRAFGLKRVKLPAGARPTFSEAYDMYGDCIVKTHGHVLAIVDGFVRDLGDSRWKRWRSGNPVMVDGERVQKKALAVWVKA